MDEEYLKFVFFNLKNDYKATIVYINKVTLFFILLNVLALLFSVLILDLTFFAYFIFSLALFRTNI